MKKVLDLDVIQSVLDKNHSRIKKPMPVIVNYAVALGLVWFLYKIMCVPDAFTVNQATILGIAGSTVISIFVLFITLDREKRNQYIEARKNAKLLSQMLDSVYTQMERVKNGSVHPIIYSESWIENYQQCVLYLEYDYFEYLLREFEIASKINLAIASQDTKQIASLLEYRKKQITDWGLNFNILAVRFNLSQFADGLAESKPWKQEKRYIEFKDFFLANYTVRVKELTVDYLKTHNGQCDAKDAEYYVMEEIRKEAALRSGTHKFAAMENKMMLSVIFTVYLSLKKEDDFSLCWGELTLNKTAN